MSTESLYDSLMEIRQLISKVKAQNNRIMDQCHGSDCVHSDANKDCEQHSRCATCPQQYMVRV